MNQKTKQIILAVVVIVVVFVAFKMFFPGSSDSSLISDSSKKQFVDGQAIITLLNRLNTVTLNEAIFSDPIFIGLVDFGRPIPDQVTGRPNPFAPIGVDGGSSVIISTSTRAR